MHRFRLTSVLLLAMALTVSVGVTSCGGGDGGSNPDLVLVGFNLPNLAGIPLNQPLIFTFSANIDPTSITPDSLRVVGTEGPYFETTVVDGNLVALLPRSPNFETYEDAGLAPGITYTVSLTTFPAVTTIESVTGKPLLEAESFTFVTQPFPVFIEPRRPVVHGVPWTQGGRSDDAGCLQNSGNALYVSPQTDPVVIQTGSGAGATLLCLQNEGAPRVVEPESVPRHDQQAVGKPSAVNAGEIELPAIRIRMNENLDPLTVVPWAGGIPINVQLWRVALKDGTFTGPDQIPTNKPVVVQNLQQTEIILVPSKEVPQGVYLVNVTPSVKDLPGNSLRIDDRPDPALSGHDLYEANPLFSAEIPPGYRIYFKTLEVPDTPLAIIEDFVNNIHEHGDNDSADVEPGLFRTSVTDAGLPDLTFDGEPMSDPLGAFPVGTRTFAATDPLGVLGGQTTSASWNSGGSATAATPITDVEGYRFLNLPTLNPNPNGSNPKPGSLQACYQPWAGSGQDLAFDSGGGGSFQGWNTNTSSLNGDGIWEFTSFHLRAGDTISVEGTRPLLILCQGDFTVEGTILLNGKHGKPGFDTNGGAAYSNASAAAWNGTGGAGGPGGGKGGDGANPEGGQGNGISGSQSRSLFDPLAGGTGMGGPGSAESAAGANDGSTGGGGGGFSSTGLNGTSLGTSVATGGPFFGDLLFQRAIALFEPDRGYEAYANISGGGGGGGGSAEDDNGASENGDGTPGPGDDAGAGGGGAGGGLWVIAKGTVTIGTTAVIQANGGDGGNTYAAAGQIIDVGTDGNPGTADDFLVGAVNPLAPGTGQGGPGGGGAGGGIFLIGRAGVEVQLGAVLEAKGGLGGTSDNAARAGGNGSAGRITLMTGVAPATVVNNSVTVTPPAASFTDWNGTVDLCSVGQSDWADLFTNNTVFDPVVDMVTVGPTFHANFAFPGNPPGFLQVPVLDGGGGKTYGAEFDARFEFQGADDLTPTVVGGPIDQANGLTPWYDVGMINQINGKRFIRWRWRFFVEEGWGTAVGDPANLPLPTVLDLTIPFKKI